MMNPLSEWQIKNLHRLVLKGIDDAYAGVYRDQQVFISGASHLHDDFLFNPRTNGTNDDMVSNRSHISSSS